MGIRRAGAIAALVAGGLWGGAGLQPAHAPSPAPVPSPHLPQTLVSPADALTALELRQPAVNGTIEDVQAYLRAEMEAAWPELEGTLAFMPYRGGVYHNTAQEFAEQVVEQYHRSSIGREMDARSGLDHVHIDSIIRHQAAALHGRELEAKRWSGSLGYHQEAQILLPVGNGEYIFRFGILALEDNCTSCTQLKPDTGTECKSVHPDIAFHERTRRLNVAFHELAHHISDKQKLPGHDYASAIDQHVEETRADMFGTFMEVRLFGPAYALRFQLMSDRNAVSQHAYKYFNPRSFKAATTWLQSEPGTLRNLPVRDILKLAGNLSQLHALNEVELEQFMAHEAHAEAKKDKAVDRVRLYHRAVAAGKVPSQIIINGQNLPYPEIAYQYDLALLRNEADGGNTHGNQLVQHNPLRSPALRGNTYAQIRRDDSAQVHAINSFNFSLFGSRACYLPSPSQGPL